MLLACVEIVYHCISSGTLVVYRLSQCEAASVSDIPTLVVLRQRE